MPRDRRASLLAVPRLPTGLRVAAIAATTDLVHLPARRAAPVWNTVGTVTNAHALHAWAKNRQTVQYEATAATTVQLPDPAQYARVPVVRCEAIVHHPVHAQRVRALGVRCEKTVQPPDQGPVPVPRCEATAATTVLLRDRVQRARVLVLRCEATDHHLARAHHVLVPVVRCEATAAMIVEAREAVHRVRVKVAPTAPLMVVTVMMKVLDPVLHVRDRSSLKRANRFLRGTFPECARRASLGGKSPLKQMVPSHDERLSPFFSWRHRFVQYVDCGAHLAG